MHSELEAEAREGRERILLSCPFCSSSFPLSPLSVSSHGRTASLLLAMRRDSIRRVLEVTAAALPIRSQMAILRAEHLEMERALSEERRLRDELAAERAAIHSEMQAFAAQYGMHPAAAGASGGKGAGAGAGMAGAIDTAQLAVVLREARGDPQRTARARLVFFCTFCMCSSQSESQQVSLSFFASGVRVGAEGASGFPRRRARPGALRRGLREGFSRRGGRGPLRLQTVPHAGETGAEPRGSKYYSKKSTTTPVSSRCLDRHYAPISFRCSGRRLSGRER